MKKTLAFSFAAIVSAIGWLCVCKCHSPWKTYKARCSFRLVDPSENFAAQGDNGTYQDFRVVAQNGMAPFLKGGCMEQELLRSYSESKMARGVSALAITNAFASANYRIEGGTGNVIQLLVSAESPDLALDVSGFILSNYVQCVDADDRIREEKALAKLRSDIKRKRLAGEVAPELLKELERVREVCESRRRKVVVLAPPCVVAD